MAQMIIMKAFRMEIRGRNEHRLAGLMALKFSEKDFLAEGAPPPNIL